MSGTTIHLKVGTATKEAFDKRALELGRKPSDVLRDLMNAFAEDRVTITPTEEQQKLYGITNEKE